MPSKPYSVATIFKWAGIAVGALLAVLLVFLWLVDWNAMRGPIARYASAKLGRPVAITGPLEVRWAGLSPRITASQVTVGNAPWDSTQPMAYLDRLVIQIKLLPLLKGDVVLPQVLLERPQLYLHREAKGRANWQMGRGLKPPRAQNRPLKLPVVRRFNIVNGQLKLVDELRKLTFTSTVQAEEKDTPGDARPFHIAGQGELNRKPFDLQIAGGSLTNLDPQKPYPFRLAVRAGDIRADADGVVAEPFDLGTLRVNVHVTGEDLADLYYLTGLALPNSPPYEIGARLERQGARMLLTGIDGTVGGSDIRGKLEIDTSGENPQLKGELASTRLSLVDLAAPLGGSRAARTATALEDRPLFPTSKLQVNRVRAMDADVRYAADAVRAGSLPLKKVSLHVLLENGVLSVKPFELDMPQGKLSGTVRVDARQDVPYSQLDLRLTNTNLDQFKGKAPGSKPPLGGTLQAHARLEGSGASVHQMLANADGSLTAVLPQGEIRAAFAELTGINVARGLGLLMKKDEERTDIRCGVAGFKIRDGTMHAEHVVFDTQDVLITVKGKVGLGSEELDLSIKGEPKKLRLFRLRTPVELNGKLRKPSIGIDAEKALSQGGIAAALSALVAPLAAVVAFVDPGLANDANCTALFAEARQTGAAR